MSDPLKVKALPPGFAIVGQALQVLLDPVKYSAAITEINEAHAAASLVVSKVGKAEEIDGLHEKATANYAEAERLLAEAKTVSARLTSEAGDAKTTIIQKSSAEAKALREETERHCDALRTRTQNYVNESQEGIKAAALAAGQRESAVSARESKLATAEKEHGVLIAKLAEDQSALQAQMNKINAVMNSRVTQQA